MKLPVSSSKVKVGAALSLVAGAAAFWYWGQPGVETRAGRPAESVRAAATFTEVLIEPADARKFDTGLELLPQSLQGTEPPAGLIIDGSGRLVVRKSLREFFDYFLSALGEESLATLRARVKAYMAKSLPRSAYLQAEHILDGYLGYRLALQSVPKAGGRAADQLDLDAVRSQKQQERSLRARYLTEEVSVAFFGHEDRYDDYTLSRLNVERDPSLSEAEKRERVNALFAQLPVEIQASMRSIQAIGSLEQLNANCQQQGCTQEQLYQQRAALVGNEAAGRLQELDGLRAVWMVRVDAYLDLRALVLGDNALSDAEKQVQILELRRRAFNAEEQLRLSAFEHGRDHPPTGQ